MRNKLALALASGDYPKGRKLVSTTYALIFAISVFLFLIFILINKYIDYAKLFNTDRNHAEGLSIVVMVVFCFFLFRLVLQLISNVINAFQLPALSSLLQLLSSLLSLVIIYFLSQNTDGSLIAIASVYSMSPVLMLLIFSFIFYSRRFKRVSPSISHIDFKYTRELLNLGFLFLINRINGLILFTTDNIIITHVSGPSEVTPYALTHKYFGLITMVFEIITIPLWTAFTDAYAKLEFDWIRNIMDKVRRLWYIIGFLLIIMIFLGKYVFNIWLGNKVEYSYTLAILMAISVAIITYVNVYSRFLNGVSKIRLATYISIAQALINIPLSIFLSSHLNLGVNGVILATIICLIPPLITHPIQSRKIIEQKDSGVWAR